MSTTRWFFLLLLLITTACQNASETESPKDARPNILFIMTDDHARKAISSYGSDLADRQV